MLVCVIFAGFRESRLVESVKAPCLEAGFELLVTGPELTV
jgi:hypothetical protein